MTWKTWGIAVLMMLVVTGSTESRSLSPTVSQGPEPASRNRNPVFRSLAELNPIDAHVHFFKNDPAFQVLLTDLKLRFLNICLIDDRHSLFKELEPQRKAVLEVSRLSSGRAAFCTTLSPYDFEDPSFSRRVILQLDKDFADGAVAVKLYKTIGMRVQTKAGEYLMPDNPVFEPVLEHIASRNRTVVAHFAEPDSCWQAPNPASPEYVYYQKHPEEHAYLHPEWPSKAAILKARDHLLAAHPKLRVVGAHLGSMEGDVREIADRLDRYPNFAVDTAARIANLMLQPSDRVRAFLIQYQDRVLYATDIGLMPDDNAQNKPWEATYEQDWKYFATDQTIEYEGRQVRGLHLPLPVLRKLYHDNAVRWIPGINGAFQK